MGQTDVSFCISHFLPANVRIFGLSQSNHDNFLQHPSQQTFPILQIKPICCTFFLSMFISFLYMFRATMCPSSGETTVSMRHLVLVILYGWLIWYAPYRMTSTKCRIDTVGSLDDGHIFARNMYRKEIKILRKILHQFGFIYKIIQGCTARKT